MTKRHPAPVVRVALLLICTLAVASGCGADGDGPVTSATDRPEPVDGDGEPATASTAGSGEAVGGSAGASMEDLEGRRACRTDDHCVAKTYGSPDNLCCVMDPRPVPLSKPFHAEWMKYRERECKGVECPRVTPTEPPECTFHAFCMRSKCVNWCDWGPTALPGTFAAEKDHLFLVAVESLTSRSPKGNSRIRFEIDGDKLTVERALAGAPPTTTEVTLTAEQLAGLKKKIDASGLLAEEDLRMPNKYPDTDRWSFGLRVETPGADGRAVFITGPMPTAAEGAMGGIVGAKAFHKAKDLVADLASTGTTR